MHSLTSHLLENYPYSNYASSKTIQRGRAYYEEGRVWDVQLDGDAKVICEVDGESGEYTVEIELDKKSGKLYFECDCPYAVDNFCKHMVAAALELRELLKGKEDYEEEFGADSFDEEEDFLLDILPKVQPGHLPYHQWKDKLETVLHAAPSTSPTSRNIQRYAAVLLMTKEKYHYYQSPYTIEPCIIKAKEWPDLQTIGDSQDPQAIHDLLTGNSNWLRYKRDLYSQTNPAGCINLNPEAFHLLSTIQQYSHYYNGATFIAKFLPLISQLAIPVFLINPSKKEIQCRVEIVPDPIDLEMTFNRDGNDFILAAGLKSDSITPGQHDVDVVYPDPPWLLVDDKLYTLRNSEHIALLSSFPISIPESEVNFFREHYLRRILETLPVQSNLIQWHEVNTDPVPRLYLHDEKDNVLRADLRFGYGDYEVAATKSNDSLSIETIPDSWDILKIQRQPEREQVFYQLLADPVYRLKRADTKQPYGTFQLRVRAHPFDFLLHSVPLLTKAGFEIYGEENLKLGKINRATPALRVNITSGIDWFDLKTVIEYGDQQISYEEMRKALKRGERYVKLADGSVGQIPEAWLEKYKHLWNLAQETSDGFRLSDFHLPLIDSLLEDGLANQPPPDLAQRRERLRSFKKIAPQPLPHGFTGELRPYQKHGYDWLHFLRQYRFGGILADDMGLGKTIQVLVYLQSLKELQQIRTAALLVVPKSLIANWQREAERFTPSLRFLEYLGNQRTKDITLFDEYDIILTTYGTMMRDIEILRQYSFHTAVLDESQAIKNPLAKSAKATRLLNAEHRLVMTGTPVENNTFELWSQFAYLNPGLLGSMEYFKKEFSTPIESGQDEQTAATLRKLIYPFILRRTKAQVAPELPLRTERIIYTDLCPAQKRLYVQTKERYRAELLGLIENDGMNDARFKILEGLLRLRQIAIHPALVKPTYRGEAPKFEVLLETLETLQSENHKALIFSQFVEILKLVKRELDQRKIKHVYLDGRTANRQAQVDYFQNNSSVPFFLISLKAGGVGLNLTAADYVIHLDPWWNPAVEMQASDRAHRIGQDKPVFVYKFIARDTVEEKILQLQEKKRTLVKSLIATETSFFKSLTRDDVKSLFE